MTQSEQMKAEWRAAAESGDIAALDALLGKGAEIDAIINSEGQTALIAAVRNNREDVARFLIGKDASVERQDIKGQTSLYNAVLGGNPDMVRLILAEKGSVTRGSISGVTPLMCAADTGRADIAGLLLDAGAPLEGRDTSGKTALAHAVAEKDDILREAAATGLDADAVISDVYEGHEATVRLLLSRGADVDARDNTRKTPLMWAAHRGHAAIVRLLLEADADIGDKDSGIMTALHWGALYEVDENVVTVLIEGGADLEAKDKNGAMPEKRAEDARNTRVAGLIKDERLRRVAAAVESARHAATVAMQEKLRHRAPKFRLKAGGPR